MYVSNVCNVYASFVAVVSYLQ